MRTPRDRVRDARKLNERLKMPTPKALASVSGSTADSDIRCHHCHKLFDVMKAEVGARTLPNTLTGLKDMNNPWVKCPHCGLTF
jgi:DNA-directed RNA polymerase subunit RPC12/RpoP